MRPRIKVKLGLRGSSDYNRCIVSRQRLEKAHREFTYTSLYAKASSMPLKEPSDDTLVTVYIFGNPIKVPYKKAKETGMAWYY